MQVERLANCMQMCTKVLAHQTLCVTLVLYFITSTFVQCKKLANTDLFSVVLPFCFPLTFTGRMYYVVNITANMHLLVTLFAQMFNSQSANDRLAT